MQVRRLLLLLAGCAHALVLNAPRLDKTALAPLFGPEQFCVIRNFLDPSLVEALTQDVRSLRARLTPAEASAQHGAVEWLVLSPDVPTRHDSDDADGLRGRDALLQFVDELQGHIQLQTGVALDAPLELKYAYYPCGGRYQKHVDGFNAGAVHRVWSFLLYLNEGWTPSDGGHLRVYDVGGSPGHIDVAPAAGTLVVFKSDAVPHEVMPTTAQRLAVVGWFHRHAEAEETDEEALSDLGRAILEHYRKQGKAVKIAPEDRGQ